MATGFNAYLIAPASLIPILSEEFVINKAAAGLTISVFFLTWGLASLPGGFLMDRYDNRFLVLIGSVVFVVASVLTAVSPNYEVFILMRMLGGATGAFLWTANTNIIGQVFPKAKLALGTGLFVAAGPTGQAIAQFLGPVLAELAGWRSVFFAYPVLVVVGLPILYMAIREPVQTDQAISLAKFRHTLQNIDILAVSGAAACSYALFSFFSSWMPTYATEVVGIELAAAGAATALVPFAGIVARPGGGWLSDWYHHRRRPVIVLSFLLTLPVIVVVTLVATGGQFAVVMFLAGGTVQLAIGVYFVYVTELADQGTTGTSLAMMTAITTMGALVAPVAGGWLIDTISWAAGYGFAIAVAILGIGVILRVPESHASWSDN